MSAFGCNSRAGEVGWKTTGRDREVESSKIDSEKGGSVGCKY